MSENKHRASDGADPTGADGDVLEGPPAAFEQDEPALAETTQGA
jgi:hypothetical protein